MFQVVDQLYLLPYCKITYNRDLNGDYEFIVGWLNREICIAF